MSKLLQKINDEVANQKQFLDSFDYPEGSYEAKRLLPILRAFKAFITDAERDLDEESFKEYSENALAVWEDE